MKKFLTIGCLFLFINLINAQPGCPAVNAGADVALPCGTNCTNLTATAFQTGGTDSYGVSQIPYTPFSYTAGTPILVSTDDVWSGIINLPFTFCFFGNAYTQVVVGANGLISFDPSTAGTFCVYNLIGSGPLPTTNVYGNSIMGPYHDIDPALGGTIKYQIIGTFPCRIFVISYYQVPMYESDDFLSTCSGMDATQQIVLYETTNAIEIYIAHKDACPDGGFFTSGWNDGLAIEGIQNASQTVAYTVPGRNNSVWTANNDAWRFTPAGPSIVSIDWFQGANQIGAGATINVCPGSNTTYTAQATYLPCSGGTPVVVTDDVNVSLAGALQASIDSSHNVTCFGANNGAAYAHATTTNAGLTYGWSNGAHTFNITGLSPGTYIFTATDASACNRSDTVVITQPTQVTASTPNVTQTNCSGTGTGTLLASALGGTGTYNYVWNSTPVQNDSALDGVSAGTYIVTVTDSKGCSATSSGTLTINVGGNTVTLNSPTIANVSCFGGNNGSITANVTGGSGTYTYAWSNFQTGSTINNLSIGQYTVTVNDGAGCTITGSYNVAQPNRLTIDSSHIINIGCNGNATGAIALFASGGVPNYAYVWSEQSNSQTYTGQSINNLPTDSYNVTVTDYNGCSVTAVYQITQATPLTFSQSQSEVLCNGGNSGSATVSVLTGTAPYTYNWNGTGASSNATLNGVSAGAVNVTITDANCSATATFNITEPTTISIFNPHILDVSCNGGSNGSISVTLSGGTPPLNAVWSNGQRGVTASGLNAGTITVTATDSNACTASQSYTIAEPTLISATTTSDSATCFGASNGSIDIAVTNGTPPYTYFWNDAQTSRTASSLPSGSYSCTVTDANACTISAGDFVGQPVDLSIQAFGNPVKCIGDHNGTITLSASGGTQPYNFSATQDFANFYYAANDIITGLSTGTYTVIVSDDNGCTKTTSAIVPDATPDTFTTTTDSTTCYGTDYSDGAAHIDATSIQNNPYQYSIDGGIPQNSGDFFNLSAGQHTITAVNNNGCTSSVNVYVLQPQPIIVNVIPDSLVLPLGESASVQVVYLNASAVTYNWTPFSGLSCSDCPNPVVQGYDRTDYTVTVSTQNGSSTCYGTANLHVEVGPHQPVFIPNSFSPNGDGNNDVFQIYGSDIKTVDLKIFNRWGEMVYKTNNVFAGWDGTYKGVLQQPGVFTYSAEVTFLDNKKVEKAGTVTLIR